MNSKKRLSPLSHIVQIIKKDMRLSLGELPMFFIVLFIIGVGCVLLFSSAIKQADTAEERFALGIVDLDNSFASKLAIQTVTKSVDIDSMFEIVNMTSTEEIYEKMNEGKMSAAIIFERGYIDRISRGETSAVDIILSEGFQIHAQGVREFAGTGEILIKTGEYGVSAVKDHIEHITDDKKLAEKRINRVNLDYATELLKMTGDLITKTVTPYSYSTVSLTSYYVILYIILALSLSDILFFDFVRRDFSRAYLQRVLSAGVGPISILIAKIPAILLTKSALLGGTLAVISKTIGISLTPASVALCILAVVYLSLISVSVSALTYSSDSGPAISAGVSFASLFLLGGLIPYDMMPHIISVIGRYTPFGVASSLLSPVFFGECSMKWLILSLIYPTLLFSLAVMTLRRAAYKGGERL